jgi:hypothetical protein
LLVAVSLLNNPIIISAGGQFARIAIGGVAQAPTPPRPAESESALMFRRPRCDFIRDSLGHRLRDPLVKPLLLDGDAYR